MGRGHLTPGMDPYREVSRTGPVEGAGSLPVPTGAHARGAPLQGPGPRGPCGAGLAALRSLQGDFVLQAPAFPLGSEAGGGPGPPAPQPGGGPPPWKYSAFCTVIFFWTQ